MVNIKISNRVLYTFIAVVIIIAIIGVGYAYNSGGPPSTIGHSSDEIELPSDICRSDGTNCNFTLNGLSGLCVERDQQYQDKYCIYESEPAYCSGGLNLKGLCSCREGYKKVPLGTSSLGGYPVKIESYYTCFKE